MSSPRGSRPWVMPFALGFLTALLCLMAVPLFVSARAGKRAYLPSNEEMERRISWNERTLRAVQLQRDGDLDGAIELMDEMIAEGDEVHLNVVVWLMDAGRDAVTLPYFRAMYRQRVRSGRWVNDTVLLTKYANLAAEHGTARDFLLLSRLAALGTDTSDPRVTR